MSKTAREILELVATSAHINAKYDGEYGDTEYTIDQALDELAGLFDEEWVLSKGLHGCYNAHSIVREIREQIKDTR